MEKNKSNLPHNASCLTCFKGKLVAVRNITANPPLTAGKKMHDCAKKIKLNSEMDKPIYCG